MRKLLILITAMIIMPGAARAWFIGLGNADAARQLIERGQEQGLVMTKTDTGQAPSMPDNLRVTRTTPVSFTLAWEFPDSDAARFRLERKTPGGAYRLIADLPGGATTYTNQGICINTTYYYRIRADNAYGESPFTAECTAFYAATRSVRLNSIHVWSLTQPGLHQDPAALQEGLATLSKRDYPIIGENWNFYNYDPATYGKWDGLTPSTLRAHNPQAKVYVYYSLLTKSDWESDYPKTTGTVTAATLTTLTDTYANWPTTESWDNSWFGATLWILSGNAAGQLRTIKSYTYTPGAGSTLVLQDGQSFSPVPDAGSAYAFVRCDDPTSLDDPKVFLAPGLLWDTIEKNNWWLRDGDGNRICEYVDTPESGNNGHIWYLDVGMPGFKERYLADLLSRLDNARFAGLYPEYGLFDGVLFDYLWTGIARFFTVRGANPDGSPKTLKFPARYAPNGDETPDELDANWFNNAWQPFFEYVVKGVQAAGYTVIGNCAGEYDPTQIGLPTLNWQTRAAWQRTILDGSLYEQGALGWYKEWLPGSTIESRINALADDPLIAWMGDSGVWANDPEYDRKQLVSLALYYVALPQDQSRRSYAERGPEYAFWNPLWDFYIGSPAELRVKTPGKFFWSRKFTHGLVLLNYESIETISFALDRKYIDLDGKIYSGSLALPAHTAKVLQTVE